MFETIKNAFKVKEIRIKIWITLLLLLVYRVGCYIPVPLIESGFNFGDVGFLQLMSSISGGALQNGTLLAMGISPYINASIIIQLLTVAIPSLERLSKQGEEGRKKIAQITKYVTILLAVAQAIGILVNFKSSVDPNNLFGSAKWLAYALLVIIYTSGACLTLWIGDRITEKGVGNGVSMLIFVGILATAGSSILNRFQNFSLSDLWVLLGFGVAVVLIFFCIVYIDLAERRVPVQYAKQVKGRKMYGGQSTNIPIKVNGNGVMPLIFAFALISFPDMIITMFWPNSSARVWYSTYMGAGSWLYIIILSLLILAFSFFYSKIQFQPEEISKSIQQNGGFIPGIRPGKPTCDYLSKISNRITLFGAIFLALIALIPSLVFRAIDQSLVNAFSATGLLIIVSVALEIEKQMQSQIMMKNYKGFLK